MKATIRKVTKAIDELVAYMLGVGATGVKMELKRMADGYVVTLSSDYSPDQRKKIEDLDKFLNIPEDERDEGIEESYWALAGASNTGEDSELHLLGQMMECISLDIEDGQVQMVLCKRSD